MLKLAENEKIIMVVRKHWFVVMQTILSFVALIAVPPIVLTFLPLVTANLNQDLLVPLINLILSSYIMLLTLLLFLFWMDYYLDMWIVTSKRIIDVEQRGLFSREISEIPLSSVQDVTISIRGVIETFLKFGTIKIQTAGEREFTISNAPNLYQIKDAILKYAGGDREQNHVRS